jgi:hypothetical protein
MRHQAAPVKFLVASGIEPAFAIRGAIGGTLRAFAARHGFTPSAVSMCIRGKQRHARVRQALTEELGVEREWLDRLLDRSAQDPVGDPTPVTYAQSRPDALPVQSARND